MFIHSGDEKLYDFASLNVITGHCV